jgi:hypothetical protein
MLAEKVVFCSSRPEAALIANHPQSDNNGEGHQDEEEKNSRMEEDSSAEDREGFRNDNFLNNRCFESAQNEPDSEMPPISEGISDFHNTEVVESASSLSNNGTVPLMTKRSPPDTSPLQRLIDDVRRLQPPAEEEVGDFDWQWLERASMLRLNHHHVAERE